MIPYDDLVVALATWRARQGLPVVSLSGAPVAPQARAQSPAIASRATPPPAPRMTPPPLAVPDTHDDPVDVEDGALIEETHYDNEGDDFAMAFQSLQQPDADDSSTAIGVPPPPGPRDSFGGSTQPEPEPPTEDLPPRKRGHNEDW
jgi:hypothetical protein